MNKTFIVKMMDMRTCHIVALTVNAPNKTEAAGMASERVPFSYAVIDVYLKDR